MMVRDVVLLHGWGSGAAVWDDIGRRLRPRFRVHALPLPGYGTDGTLAARSLEEMIEPIARVAPRRCAVAGWSLGGEVALAWALRAPLQVQRIALIATTPCFTSKPGWTCATPGAVLREFGKAIKADRADTLARFVGVQVRGDARARQGGGMWQRLYEQGVPDAVLEAGLAALSGADLRQDLRRVRQPALVLHGARDRIVPPVAGRRLAAALPVGRFQLLRACAHVPFLSQPVRVARALRDFFDE